MNAHLATVVFKEVMIIQRVRNILHAHNRPDTPLYNDRRIEARGLLEGVIRRLNKALVSEETS